LSEILTNPECITHQLQRAKAGEWLPQALQSRRQTLASAMSKIKRQQSRLLEIYLAEVISRDEFERKRSELSQTLAGLQKQLNQIDADAQKQINLAKLASGIEDFSQRIQLTLDQLDFAQRRKLVELLVDRVIINDEQVEIRYAIPTSPKGEKSPFCHLRKDYFYFHTLSV
jgi:site-specific DNA recombinase